MVGLLAFGRRSLGWNLRHQRVWLSSLSSSFSPSCCWCSTDWARVTRACFSLRLCELRSYVGSVPTSSTSRLSPLFFQLFTPACQGRVTMKYRWPSNRLQQISFLDDSSDKSPMKLSRSVSGSCVIFSSEIVWIGTCWAALFCEKLIFESGRILKNIFFPESFFSEKNLEVTVFVSTLVQVKVPKFYFVRLFEKNEEAGSAPIRKFRRPLQRLVVAEAFKSTHLCEKSE